MHLVSGPWWTTMQVHSASHLSEKYIRSAPTEASFCLLPSQFIFCPRSVLKRPETLWSSKKNVMEIWKIWILKTGHQRPTNAIFASFMVLWLDIKVELIALYTPNNPNMGVHKQIVHCCYQSNMRRNYNCLFVTESCCTPCIRAEGLSRVAQWQNTRLQIQKLPVREPSWPRGPIFR